MAVQMLQGSCSADYGAFVISGRGSHILTESLRSSSFISELQGLPVGTGRRSNKGSEYGRTLCVKASCRASIWPEPWCRYGFQCCSNIMEPRRFPRNFGNVVCCNNSFSELGSAATVEWTPAVDNLLLVLSIALAYVAGIITPSTTSKALPVPSKGSTPAKPEGFKQTSEVQGKTNDVQSWKHDMWDGIRVKILKGMDVVDDVHDRMSSKGMQLSIQALAKGPQLRMLLITLEQLKKEVGNVQASGGYVGSDWSNKSTRMLCDSVIPVFQRWVSEEQVRSMSSSSTTSVEWSFSLYPASTCTVPVEGLPKPIDVMVDDDDGWQYNSLLESDLENYAGKDLMMNNLKETGKVEFYADFLYFICTGCVREKSFCGVQTLRRCKALILEDLVIYVADRVSALFLDLVSAGNSICDDQWLNVIAHPISSTRMLEKLRNEVALNSWIIENFQSVTAMFEDRFDLWILKAGIMSPNGKKRSSSNNSKGKAKDMEHSNLVIEQYRLSARRGRQLRALSGWRYYYSLYLEFSDICGPLLRTLVIKVGEGISFLLVTLIGRSLGLIYRGICQSIQWTSK